MFQKSSSTLTICGVMLFQPLILRGRLSESSLASVPVNGLASSGLSSGTFTSSDTDEMM